MKTRSFLKLLMSAPVSVVAAPLIPEIDPSPAHGTFRGALKPDKTGFTNAQLDEIYSKLCDGAAERSDGVDPKFFLWTTHAPDLELLTR